MNLWRLDSLKGIELFPKLGNNVKQSVERHFMTENHVILSEKLEDLLKAVEWGKEQQRKIMDERGEEIADALMEKMTPKILERTGKNAG